MSTPKRNGSVLAALMCSRYPLPSVVRSEHNSVRSFLQLLMLGVVNSEHQRKPKKARVNAPGTSNSRWLIGQDVLAASTSFDR